MGVDVWSLNFLMGLREHPFGDTLLLGRQNLYLPVEFREMAERVITSQDPSIDPNTLLPEGGYASALFEYLGSTSLKALDYSSYEGAEIIHDLNTPVGSALVSKFDTIFDGGTLEHVFDFPVASNNVKKMLRVGGRFIMVTPSNNWLGHGLYQFSPELLYRVFSRSAGFEVERMEFVDIYSYPAPRCAEDPEAAGGRIELHMTAAPTFLCMAVKKLREGGQVRVQQSDYVSRWKFHDR